MLNMRTKRELAQLATQLAQGLELVQYKGGLYVPLDYETLQAGTVPPPERTVWQQIDMRELTTLANNITGTLFTTDSEKRSFYTMAEQVAGIQRETSESVLINTDQGLMRLTTKGELVPATGEFCANYITVPLNTDAKRKEEMRQVFITWLNSEEAAESLLTHLATVLAPHWSATRYVLLIGDGRNGKSVMMHLMVDLLGHPNVSHVTRQQMASSSPTCHDLTGKLLNVVFDGEATYIKDSGLEKTLTAGEQADIRKLYESTGTPVLTKALFIEGLNREPKTSDKSGALQKRIIRFHLPNVYEQDQEFEAHLRSPEMLGALLSLLIDRYVQQHELAEKLKLTRMSIELKLEQMHFNSVALQFIEHVEFNDPLGVGGVIDSPINDLVVPFQQWRLKINDVSVWEPASIVSLLMPLFTTERKSVRIAGKPSKVRVITGLKPDVIEFLEYVRGEEEENYGDILDTLVEDADLQPESAPATD